MEGISCVPSCVSLQGGVAALEVLEFCTGTKVSREFTTYLSTPALQIQKTWAGGCQTIFYYTDNLQLGHGRDEPDPFINRDGRAIHKSSGDSR